MASPELSVIIPARNEPHLQRTVEEVLAKATRPVEVIAVLDGYVPAGWPFADNRVKTIHHVKALGMRPSINEGMALARGAYVMKLDAHCLLAEGFDEVLSLDCDDDIIVVPRRYELDPVSWTIKDDPVVAAHRLTYPFPEDRTRPAMWGTGWPERAEARKHILIDEEISSQGSCYYMSRKMWDRIGPLDGPNYRNIVNEAEELCFRAWLGGGRAVVNKGTYYAHWTKVSHRLYSITRGAIDAGYEFCVRYWMLDQWEGRIHDFRWLIEKFMPMPDWPEDLDEVFRYAHEVLQS